ncbi:ankyrin repeat-containing domain protein [Aspergillus recurvatus]
MAEALGLAVNVAAVIQVAAEIAQLSYKYARDVKNAPRTQKAYLQEVSALMEVLFRIEQAVQDAESTGLLPHRPASLSADTVMDCYKALSGLYFDLQKRRSRFLQPLHEREWRAHIDMLTKYRSLFVDFLSSCVLTTGTATYNKVSLMKEEQDRSLLLTWLPAPNASARRRPSPCPGTGSWFLAKDSVRQWVDGSNCFLWCYGAPGVGKSFLASRVIDRLLEARTPADYPVLYFFCDFASQEGQRVIDILHHLLRQVIEQGSAEVLGVLKESCKDPGRLQQATEVTQLIAAAGLAKPMYLVLDAVDELRDPAPLLSHITTLVSSGINVLITSRDLPHIRKNMKPATHLEITSNLDDLKVYIESRFRDSDFSDEVEEEDKLVGDVASSSGNLFLLTRLLLDDILDLASINQIRKALRKPHANLHQAFQATMDRIESQSKARSFLARRLLGWITYAKRRLKLQEVRCAFSVEEGEELDPDNKPNPDILLRACHGLVVVDKVDGTLGLVHTTAYEFFRNGEVLSQKSDFDIARTSLQYLTMSDISLCSTSTELLKRLESLEFLDYSARYWGRHICSPDEERQLQGLINKLLRESRVRNGAFQVLQYRQEFADGSLGEEMLQSIPTDLGTLHIAAYWGLVRTTEMLLADGASVYEVDSHKWTALHWACSRRHAGVAEILMNSGADVNARDIQGWTPLFWAAFNGDDRMATLLLNHGANHLSRSTHGWTALHWAVSSGHPEAVRILLEHHTRSQAKDTELLKMSIQEVIAYAESVLPVEVAADGHDAEIFSLLAEHLQTPEGDVGDAQFNKIWADAKFDEPASGNPWRTITKAEKYTGLEYIVPTFRDLYRDDATIWKTVLLLSAIRDGQLSSARLLAKTGADVDSGLYPAACRRDPSYVRCLLENGGDPNKPSHGKIPLHEAVLNGFVDTAAALIDGGADVNQRELARNSREWDEGSRPGGATPLILACGLISRKNPETFRDMARLLIARGADPKLGDASGKTVLHYAVMEPCLPLIELLVSSGCPVDARDVDGRLPVHYLGRRFSRVDRLSREDEEVWINLPEIVRILLDAKLGPGSPNVSVCCRLAKVNGGATYPWDGEEDHEGHTPIGAALATGRWEVAIALHAAGACIPDYLDLNPIADAAIKDFAGDAVDFLLDHGAQPPADAVHILLDALSDRLYHDKTVNDVLQSQFKYILSKVVAEGADVFRLSEHGDTVLAAAAWISHNIDVVKDLVEIGADIFSVSDQCFEPILVVAAKGNTECLGYLLDYAAAHPRENHWSMLLHEIGQHSDPFMRLCICLRKAQALDRTYGQGRTLLHLAAMNDNVSLITSLLACGARHDIADAQGLYAVHEAGLSFNAAALQALLSVSENADTALTGAETQKAFWLEVLAQRIDSPPWSCRKPMSILELAVNEGKTEIAQRLLEYGMDPDARIQGWFYERPILYEAAATGQHELVEILLAHGAGVKVTDKSGWTPLHAACYFGHAAIARALIEAGSDIHAETAVWYNCDPEEWGSPYKAQSLHLATMAGNAEIVQMLLVKGADPHALIKGRLHPSEGTDYGPTALHLALAKLDEDRLRIAQWMVDRGLMVHGVVSNMGAQEIWKFKDFPDLWDALRAGEMAAQGESAKREI